MRRQLKKKLKQLKNDAAPASLDRLKYISKVFRLNYNKKTHRFLNADQIHNDRIKRTFGIITKMCLKMMSEFYQNSMKKLAENIFKILLKNHQPISVYTINQLR